MCHHLTEADVWWFTVPTTVKPGSEKNDAVRDKNFTAMLSGHHVWLLMYRRGFTQAPAGSQIAEHHLFSIWTI